MKQQLPQFATRIVAVGYPSHTRHPDSEIATTPTLAILPRPP